MDIKISLTVEEFASGLQNGSLMALVDTVQDLQKQRLQTIDSLSPELTEAGENKQSTPAPAAAPVYAHPAAAPAPTPAAAPAANADTLFPATLPNVARQYSFDDLAVAATSLMDQGKQPQLLNLLAGYDVQALTQLPKELYNAFASDLKELGAAV